MAGWNELNERVVESTTPLPGLPGRVDAHVLPGEGTSRSLSPFERAGTGAHTTPHSPCVFDRLAETALNSLILLVAGPPVLALRFGYAAVHRRRGLST